MIDETLAIDELVLHIPGLAADRARDVAAEVARVLADKLAGDVPLARVPASLDLRFTATPGVTPTELARQIADQILEALS